MEEVIRIFKEIQDTSSLNQKSAIITANRENELFKKCLRFLLDDMIVTGISEKKIYKQVAITNHIDITCDFETIMDYLQVNNSGRDSDISLIQGFINKQPEHQREFYRQIITKTFRLGCNSKVVNKVIPNLIPTFDVMLGTPIDKCKIKDGEWISLSRKLNGTRCAFIGNKCMTRQGKEYVGLQHIISDLLKFEDGSYKNMFLDGELLYKNKEGLSDSEAFQKGTGLAMSKEPDKSELKFVIFDAFPLEEFWSGKSKKSYKERKENLKIIGMDFADSENIEVVPILYEGTDHSEIWKWLDYAEDNDWEGIMINLDAIYECKRTKSLIKVKKFFSCDIKCIDIEEGSGRNKETLGALVCDYKGNRVNVGSGFSDVNRKHFWLHPEDVVGHMVSVKYKEETKNKDGGISIQFPVFECVRFDKNEPSYN